MLPPELANPFRRPPAVPLNPDTAGMIGDMLGPEAKKAFEALDDEPPKPRAKPTEPTEEEKAAMRKAEKGLLERSRESLERFPTWRTVPLGEYKTAEELISALRKRRFKISNLVSEIMEKIHLSGSPHSVELVNVSIEDFGFEKQATLPEVYDRAEELGLSLCPPEVGPALRLYYTDQPIGENICVAMEPIAVRGADLDVFFVVYNDGDRWLNIDNSHHRIVRSADRRFVFLRSKKK